MRPDQEFLLTMSNKLDAQETLIAAQRRLIDDMTAMSKTHYAVPKAVTKEEAQQWWTKNEERFTIRDTRGRWLGYSIVWLLTEFCNERAEMRPKPEFQLEKDLAMSNVRGSLWRWGWKDPDSVIAKQDDIDGVPV